MRLRRIGPVIFWVIIFSIAMGFFESALVVYLRELYYPNGFNFPLQMMDAEILKTELFREAFSLLMIIAVAFIAGRRPMERFAFFLLIFAIWDISYYMFLKLILNWPESFMTFDILFLIPLTWTGPVLAPVINSITMIMLAFLIIRITSKNGKTISKLPEWILLLFGSLVIIIAYTMEYAIFMLKYFSFAELISLRNSEALLKHATEFIPIHFAWKIFIIGTSMHILAIIIIAVRNTNRTKRNRYS